MLSIFIMEIILQHVQILYYLGFPVTQTVKNLPIMWETWFDPRVGKIPWRREWLPFPVFLPGEFHGQRSLAATVHGVTKSRAQAE